VAALELVDYGGIFGLLTLLVTLVVSLERLFNRIIGTLKVLSVILSQLESAFADDKGGLSEVLTSSVVSTERSLSPSPDKGAEGANRGVSP
jgi:hypothetical protein